MDTATLASLRAALELSPENLELRLIVVKALQATDPPAAAALLDAVDPASLRSHGAGALGAAVALAAERPDRGLELLGEPAGPAETLLQARILLALGRREEAERAYRNAVRENPTLEDPELETRLHTTIRVVGGRAGGPKLRVVSNDDTDRTELNRLLHPEAERITFADIGGLDEIKREIERRIILPFRKPSLFQRFRKRVGGGVLLYGPPGCGKTMLARATAGESGAKFFSVAIADVLDMYIGESERKLKALFEQARESAPAVLFFDEIEALGGKRANTREGTSSALISLFLAEMDGFAQNNHGVLILGATNVPWSVDPAFRRPGRFDRVLFVAPPDREARRHILALHLAERPTEGELPIAEIAAATSGVSGADLAEVVETAADEAIAASLDAGSEIGIRAEHLRAALKRLKPTTGQWLTTARNYARYANEGGQYDEVLAFLERHAK
jgi:ATP-dependent 26S proteasome regulatory subunit